MIKGDMRHTALLIWSTLLLATMFLSACGVTSRQGTRPQPEGETTNVSSSAEGLSHLSGRTLKRAKVIEKKLLDAHSQWKGTPYVNGGESQNGVDCSAFVQIVMQQQLGIKLPRTTEEQLNEGRKVKNGKFLPGDLLFFKTGRKTYHVGIVLNNKKFLHASTSDGVKIAGYRTGYWRNKFIGARRFL